MELNDSNKNSIKILYWGIGGSGKTTIVDTLYRLPSEERIDIEQYPNMRAFLQAKQLKLTTTGRRLANLKRISEDVSREGQILIAEILELRDNNYSPEAITSLRSYLTDELSRWESENITTQQFPIFTRQRILSAYVCYEQDIAELLEIAMRYENLIDDESCTPEYIHRHRGAQNHQS